MNKSVKQGRFELLDLCRGIAALIVVGIHTFRPNMQDFWPVVIFLRLEWLRNRSIVS